VKAVAAAASEAKSKVGSSPTTTASTSPISRPAPGVTVTTPRAFSFLDYPRSTEHKSALACLRAGNAAAIAELRTSPGVRRMPRRFESFLRRDSRKRVGYELFVSSTTGNRSRANLPRPAGRPGSPARKATSTPSQSRSQS